MALTDFFRINMPYGLLRNANGEWMAFNREYQPLGYSKKVIRELRDPVVQETLNTFAKYHGLSDAVLSRIVESTNEHFETDESGKYTRVWLYKDANNPSKHPANWPAYVEKLQLLGGLQVK